MVYGTKVWGIFLSYDVVSGSEIMSCIKIDRPLVVYRFSGTLLTPHIYGNTLLFLHQKMRFK